MPRGLKNWPFKEYNGTKSEDRNYSIFLFLNHWKLGDVSKTQERVNYVSGKKIYINKSIWSSMFSLTEFSRGNVTSENQDYVSSPLPRND